MSFRDRWILVVALAAVLSPAASWAQQTAAAPAYPAPPPGVEYATSVEGIHEYALANGLRVLLFPDPSKETITVNITYLVGSRHENYGETGMAHLLEHLMFKGTPRFPNVPDELTKHGGRSNGTTWLDRTNYFETVPATEENLAWALEFEADRMVNSFIAQKDLDSEMTVVRNEFESGENDPRAVLEERVTSTAYLWHNYGNSTIGARSDIENVPIERLQAFYRTWYQPDNALLVISGDFEPVKTLARVQATFGAIPRPSRALPVTYTSEPAQDGERTVTLRRVGDTQIAMMAYHVPSGSHPDFTAVEALAFILGDTPSGRLHKALVETGRASAINGWAYLFAEPSLALFTADLRLDGDIAAARDEMVRVIEGAAETPPTPEEFARAHDRLLKDWERSLRHSEWAAVGLSEWAALGDWRLLFLQRDRLRDLTAEDVRRVAAAYFRPSNRTAGLFIPTKTSERTEIPPTPDIAALVGDYEGEQALAAGEDFLPTPENIESRVLRSTLPSGLKISLLSKGTRGEIVNVSLGLHFGDAASLRGLASVGEMTGIMLMRGTESRSRQQIQDEMDRLKAQIDAGGSATGAWANIEVPREGLEAALRLAVEIMKEPSFPAAEFELLRKERITEVEEGKSEPFQIAMTRMQRHQTPWPSDDVRYVATPDERIAGIEAVTVEAMRAFHERFYGASAGEMAVVGDFDPTQAMSLATEVLGGWKSPAPYARLETPYAERPSIHEAIETPDKENAVFLAGLRIAMRDDDPEYPALLLGNFMTGGGFLNSRLAKRIRQKEGFSYGVRSNFFVSSWDRSGWFGAFAIHAPQNSEKLEAAFREEIARILEAGFTDVEIAEAKSGLLQARQVGRNRDGEVAATLRGRDELGRTFAWDGDVDRRIEALTGQEILEAVRKHFVPARMSYVIAGDFAGAAARGAAR